MVTTRGSWTLDEAITKRWDEDALEDEFKAEWRNTKDTNYPVLHDGEARPTPPGPYCVFEKDIPVILGHMSGADVIRSDTENQLQEIGFQFTIHAKSTATESGKVICIRLAKKVAAAFDPDRPLDFEDDYFVVAKRGPDFSAREGDTEWAWVLQYEATIDAEYLQAT